MGNKEVIQDNYSLSNKFINNKTMFFKYFLQN